MQEQFGILNPELKWFQSYFTNRTQVCVVDGHISSEMKVICRVPQESILGPFMFLIYINDLPDICKTQPVASSASFSELVLKLYHDLENIIKWLSQNKLQLHTDKSKMF